MKTISILSIAVPSCLLLLACQRNQEKDSHFTITTMPEHRAERIALFGKDSIVPGQIIFLGNSITEMGEWQILLKDSTVLNRGIGGDLSYGLLERLQDITKRKPSKVFLMVGINDLARGIAQSQISDNCRKILEKIRKESPHTQSYLQSVLPVNPAIKVFPKNYNKKEAIKSLNHRLKQVADSMNVLFINLYPLFVNEDGNLKEQFTYDGLHLTKEGYKVWTDHLKQESYYP